MKKLLTLIVLLFIIPIITFGQGRPYEGPEDPAADISAMRSGYMNGNRVLLYYENNTRIGEHAATAVKASKWPNNYEGLIMYDNLVMLAGSEVYIHNDSIPITDLSQLSSIPSNELDTLYYMQSHYHHADFNYDRTIGWMLYPVPGYVNETQDFVAINTKPDTWPPEGWPSRGFEKKWLGEWNGRFGRGIMYADLETYYVANDAQDLENIVERNDPEENLITEGPRYFPRPGKFIGDINPNVTVQKGYPWGGLGLRIAVRGYQWNNPEARDIIFWEYDISNISDYDLPSSGLGFYLDFTIGVDDDELGYYNKEINLAYAWDHDGIGQGGIEPGACGAAYLESPGIPYDGVDNDNDGLLDEKRDNLAGNLIGPQDGINDLSKFLHYYHLKEEDLRDHFEGDEDQDWDDGIDLNNNGRYASKNVFGEWKIDRGEYAGDDVGLDGVGPGDLNYLGPDEGECNHIPDFLEGSGCEPDFAATDVNESDMQGLTSFNAYNMGQWQKFNWMPEWDEEFWKLIDNHEFDEVETLSTGELYFTFGSTPFPLYKGRTERISMAMVHAYESLQSLNSSDHNAPSIFFQKKIAQIIYERDYRFSQPPLMPTLTATPSDGKIILTWDDTSDKLTREPMLANANDFEGYKLYRATDKLMSDSEVITDGHGTKMFKKPIYQCDLIDSLEGYTDFGLVGGKAFYLGDETGLTHYFVDENVQNGRTYYYALVAYDYGAKEIGDGIAPTENNIVIELDEAEEIIRMGRNVAIVTPHQMAAGYTDPNVITADAETMGSGEVSLSVVDRNSIRVDHQYKLKFTVDTLGHARKNKILRHPLDVVKVNNGLKIYDVTDSNRIVYEETIISFPSQNILTDGETRISNNATEIEYQYYRNDKAISTDIFEGIQLELNDLAVLGSVDEEKSGWLVGEMPIKIEQSKYESHGFPFVYDIIFTNNDTAHTPKITRESYIFNLDGSSGTVVGSSFILTEYILGRSFSFYVVDRSNPDSNGLYQPLEIIVEDVNRNGTVELLEDRFLVSNYVSPGSVHTYWGGTIFGFSFWEAGSEDNLPKPGDIYRVSFRSPFTEIDSILFTVASPVEMEEVQLAATMEDIKVVPNPYVMSNSMEPAVGNKFLNQRRRIMFTHIPAQSVIKIYTSSGVLVDKIDVDNEPSDGTVHWDLLSKEDLEIAAGMYIYHIKSSETGDEKIGKFAVIK